LLNREEGAAWPGVWQGVQRKGTGVAGLAGVEVGGGNGLDWVEKR